jgi:hypothetical protein
VAEGLWCFSVQCSVNIRVKKGSRDIVLLQLQVEVVADCDKSAEVANRKRSSVCVVKRSLKISSYNKLSLNRERYPSLSVLYVKTYISGSTLPSAVAFVLSVFLKTPFARRFCYSIS